MQKELEIALKIRFAPSSMAQLFQDEDQKRPVEMVLNLP